MTSIWSLFMLEVWGTPLVLSLTCLCCRWSLPVGTYRGVRESDTDLTHNGFCVLRLLNSQAWNGIRPFKECVVYCWIHLLLTRVVRLQPFSMAVLKIGQNCEALWFFPPRTAVLVSLGFTTDRIGSHAVLGQSVIKVVYRGS